MSLADCLESVVRCDMWLSHRSFKACSEPSLCARDGTNQANAKTSLKGILRATISNARCCDNVTAWQSHVLYRGTIFQTIAAF